MCLMLHFFLVCGRLKFKKLFLEKNERTTTYLLYRSLWPESGDRAGGSDMEHGGQKMQEGTLDPPLLNAVATLCVSRVWVKVRLYLQFYVVVTRF